MRKRHSFWILTAIALGVWLSIIWIAQARQGIQPVARGARSPLQQACSDARADLIVRTIEVDSRGIDQPFDVRVAIRNDSTGTNGLVDSWAYLYVDRTPTGAPDVQAFAQTSVLTVPESEISANFTVTSGHATVGWHTVSVVIDATNAVPNEGCGGENNNEGATSFEIVTVQPTDTPRPTPTTPPTPTPFPRPDIFQFEPAEKTIGRGDAVTLRWQVSGESVSVTLDGEPVPMEASVDRYPTESHVYILRAENPGGIVQETSDITVAEPTITPTPTEVPCDYPTIHEFGASPASVNRGERVTIFWDVEGADQVFLNGEPVSDVSDREFKLNRTTTYTLVARNACGEVEEALTVQAKYATATPTYTPTVTRTPTRTSTPTPTPRLTSTPTRTPTRNVLPTYTGTATPNGTRTGIATPTMTSTSSAFDSPVGTPTGTAGTPTGTAGTPTETAASLTVTATTSATAAASITATVSISATGTLTPSGTSTPASTDTPSPTPSAAATATQAGTATPSSTPTVIQPTSTVDLSGPVAGETADATSDAATRQTPDVGPAQPMASPTAIPPVGTIRMYLCPLAVLLLFAVGVVILSIVVPRIQERQQDSDEFGYSAALYGVAASEGSENGPPPSSPTEPEPAVLDVDNPPVQAQDEPLLADERVLKDVSFAPNGPLLDAARALEDVSFDPLLDELALPDPQEAERASTSPEETA